MQASAQAQLEGFCAEQFPRLVRMLDLLLHDVHVAEELAQETLVRAASRWDQVATLDSPEAWVRRVARNLATSAWRRRQAARRAAARIGPSDDIHVDADVGIVDQVRTALAALSPSDREVLVLRHHVGLSIAETAAELGLTESAAKSRAARAATRFRTAMAPTTDHQETSDVR